MKTIKLYNGLEIPIIGMGTNTFGKENNDFYGKVNFDTKELIMAYNNGYRHIDTAIMYNNEEVIGKSLNEIKLNRKEIFITSKIPTKQGMVETDDLIEKNIKDSLNKIGTYIDLYLIHHPSTDEINLKVWKLMIKHYELGNFKSIGVSNFNENQIKYLIENSEVKPMVNQIESNPAKFNHELIKYCLINEIAVVAWGPLDPVPNKDALTSIGLKYNKTWAQVLLNYQISRGVIVIPKSHNDLRQKENIDIFDFKLSKEDILQIEK